MKATGIVRRIDDLGRVVIPIELRRTLGIGEKDSLEIFVDGDSVILRKYRRHDDKEKMIDQLSIILEQTNNQQVFDIINNTIDFIKKA